MVLDGVQTSWIQCIQTYVAHSLQLLGIITGISSLSQTTTPDMGTYTWYIRNLKSLDMFKIYKVKVENQENRKIKAIRSDRGGEYYDRYDGFGRYPRLFANFLKECGIYPCTLCQGTSSKWYYWEAKSHTTGHG